ncbi:MAG TPA: hemerythrin domain-containing protein [Steroidobacteraceae bacterium]|jgi:hemerythrin superfamily protein
MSVLDKFIAAVTPPESAKARADARRKAQQAAGDNDWLALILEHHLQIEAAFESVKSAASAPVQRAAQKQLAALLTGHSVAEEAVIYPALVSVDEKAHSTKAYTEQSAAKVQLGLLEDLEPLTQDYLDKLEHLRGAVAHHVYEEEGTWFLELKDKLLPVDQERLTERYREEFLRYMGVTEPSASVTPVRRPQVGLGTSGQLR